MRRYAEHDTEVRNVLPKEGRVAVQMQCTRCQAVATGCGPDEDIAVYASLVALEHQLCAIVAFDENGYPYPVLAQDAA